MLDFEVQRRIRRERSGHIRDGRRAFIGSQSLRKLELEGRREVGIIVKNGAIVRKIAATFEDDWRRSKKSAW